MSRLNPPAMIGIIGGGQLGQMMAISAKKSGYRIAVVDPDENCPCASLADVFICARYDDESALDRLVKMSDVVTYEFENADADLIRKYEMKIPQGHQALRYSQHRLVEKDFARSLGIPCPNYVSIQSEIELHALDAFPIVLKTCRFGYDGKGQWLIRSKEDLAKHRISFPNDYIAESFVGFTKEISVVCCRFKDGIAVYEPFENRHAQGILREATHPASVPSGIKTQAIEATKKIVEKLDYIGVLAVEYFVTDDGILFNEMAPRPHNSAHGTIEGCDYSQFDLHVAAITGQAMIQPKTRFNSKMINLLGQDVEEAQMKWNRLDKQNVFMHLYGKPEIRVNRKMGHITVIARSNEELEEIAKPWRTKE